jgi:hypothetical protein
MSSAQSLAVVAHEPPPHFPAIAAVQFRERAAEYRRMATTARMVGTDEALLRLAARFEALATQQETALR